jgi:hypothetical protein
MIARLSRLALALLLPFALASCVLAPGKFVSTLKIDADRHFTFTYVGEVIALDLGDDMMKGLGDSSSDSATNPAGDQGDGDGTPMLQQIGFQAGKDMPDGDDAKDAAKKKAAADAKNREIAATLSKEAGYRKVAYLGDSKFSVDYAISGTLDHAFLWPYNVDAELVFPFIAIELRANNTVRMKAPAFANDTSKSSGMAMPGMDKASSQLDGVFTLDTNAEIVSQNNEDGATTAGGRKTIMWKATPLTKDAPTAVLRLAAK